MNPRVGIVVIGRNEGERLDRCLRSLQPLRCPVVYVDSGSTDGSLALAERLGAFVVALDPVRPFTAARARNEGFRALLERVPDIEFVHFVDGDCELHADWVAAAIAFLDAHPQVGCVCGRLRERHPDRSVYNRLCDAEWDRAPGAVEACGGIALMRRAVFEAAGGFPEGLLSGEEPELCRRMRAQGHLIWRLPHEMALHDAAMLQFRQWWIRSKRTGYGFAHACALHPRDRAAQLCCARGWLWAVSVPLAVVAATFALGWPGLALLGAYPLQIARMTRSQPTHRPLRLRLERAFFLLLGKLPEVLGQIQFLLRLRHATSFDYKVQAPRSR